MRRQLRRQTQSAGAEAAHRFRHARSRARDSKAVVIAVPDEV